MLESIRIQEFKKANLLTKMKKSSIIKSELDD
jgi:hypothetical protein